MEKNKFSDYVVYVDESGDHNLVSIDRDYPVFVLAFCIFHKRHYAEAIVPAVEKFKFGHFGHDAVVLHEREIRQQKGSFKSLTDRLFRDRFMGDLTTILEQANFILLACLIDKNQLAKNHSVANNPYHLALGVCLEQLWAFLVEKQQEQLLTHVLVECRGKQEDAELELEFRRVCDGQNSKNLKFPFDIQFVDKKANLPGLQMADLVARPIGVNHLRPKQENRAFEVLKKKLFCKGGRKLLGVDYLDYGLVVLPKKAKGLGEPTEATAPTGNPQST